MAALEAYASRNADEVHTDVLLKARQACYKSRDAFYDCLEKESNKKPTEIASVGLLYPAECKALRAQFVNHCRASWVFPFFFFFLAFSFVPTLLLLFKLMLDSVMSLLG